MPGRSFLLRESRPWNLTVFTPTWPFTTRVPRVTVRVQCRARRLRCVGATHLPWTLRPPTLWVNAKETFAGVLSANENDVPTGTWRRRLICASPFPSRQRERNCLTDASAGTGGAVVNVWSAPNVVPPAFVATTLKW